MTKKRKYDPRQIALKPLTEREIEIIGLIAKGKTSPEIAKQLFVTNKTIETHRHNILIKTNCRNVAELILYYLHVIMQISLFEKVPRYCLQLPVKTGVEPVYYVGFFHHCQPATTNNIQQALQSVDKHLMDRILQGIHHNGDRRWYLQVLPE